ncbi:hypothetical protein Leryth_015549 [Lithospermum erythrorhizon]|nr:hypothetical protein Leryth_015549 [Lithospermum erythrorhizon]
MYEYEMLDGCDVGRQNDVLLCGIFEFELIMCWELGLFICVVFSSSDWIYGCLKMDLLQVRKVEVWREVFKSLGV